MMKWCQNNAGLMAAVSASLSMVALGSVGYGVAMRWKWLVGAGLCIGLVAAVPYAAMWLGMVVPIGRK